jgi:hypothetical protein
MLAHEIEALFDDALRCRDAGDLATAKAKLTALIGLIPASNRRWLAITHGTLAHVHSECGDARSCVVHAKLSTEFSPHAELPSLTMFVALKRLGEFDEAFREAIRFLALRRSDEYVGYFDNDYLIEAPRLSPDTRHIAEAARRLARAWNTKRPD